MTIAFTFEHQTRTTSNVSPTQRSKQKIPTEVCQFLDRQGRSKQTRSPELTEETRRLTIVRSVHRSRCKLPQQPTIRSTIHALPPSTNDDTGANKSSQTKTDAWPLPPTTQTFPRSFRSSHSFAPIHPNSAWDFGRPAPTALTVHRVQRAEHRLLSLSSTFVLAFRKHPAPSRTNVKPVSPSR